MHGINNFLFILVKKMVESLIPKMATLRKIHEQNVEQWTPEQFADWLVSVNPSWQKYAKVFLENEVICKLFAKLKNFNEGVMRRCG